MVPAMTRVALFLIGAPGTGAEKRAIAPAGVKPIGPYSPGILAGDFLYVSGQGGRDAVFVNPYLTDKASSRMNDIYESATVT
jgi:enamine deaminase RidA (YjgF/YER057c/UK114 family)